MAKGHTCWRLSKPRFGGPGPPGRLPNIIFFNPTHAASRTLWNALRRHWRPLGPSSRSEGYEDDLLNLSCTAPGSLQQITPSLTSALPDKRKLGIGLSTKLGRSFYCSWKTSAQSRYHTKSYTARFFTSLSSGLCSSAQPLPATTSRPWQTSGRSELKLEPLGSSVV